MDKIKELPKKISGTKEHEYTDYLIQSMKKSYPSPTVMKFLVSVMKGRS